MTRTLFIIIKRGELADAPYIDKVSLTRAFKKQVNYLMEHGSNKEKESAKRLLDQFKVLSTQSDKHITLNKLFAADHPGDVPVETDEERRIRELVVNVVRTCSMPGKDNISELEHTMRNMAPYLDATVGCDQECRVHYGEQTLEPTAVRRNTGSNPNDRARVGYKVDVIIEYRQLSWFPVVACGEISGGLPRCPRSKEWTDTLKLSLELRDVWVMAQKELVVAEARNLTIWGFTLVDRKLRVYTLSTVRELFHLVLVHEVSLPSSRRDLVNVRQVYFTMMGFAEKIEVMKRTLDNLNERRVAMGKRERTPEKNQKEPKIIMTPL